jgi:hypothetical protein
MPVLYADLPDLRLYTMGFMKHMIEALAYAAKTEETQF